MARSGKLELDNETGMKKSGGYHCSIGQLVLLAVVVAALVIGVGCMAFFLPGRSCKPTSTVEPPVAGEQTTHIAPTPIEENWNGRLPRNLIPQYYHLYLKPYLYEEDLGAGDRLFTFDGQVKINMTCDNATHVITLHVKNITIITYALEDETGNAVSVSDVTYETKYDFVHFHVDVMLEASNSYMLKIDYVGELSDGFTGFYRDSYKEGGETKWLATSQMQATHARRALPCFDEPDLRAVFNTQIEHRADMVALTNGIEEDEILKENGWIKTKYRATPLMPTYLLAFTVGYFNYTEKYSDKGVRYRVWSRPEKLKATRYALNIGINMTSFFESYFNISFDLPKQDMIATPSGGAMENWGLIIYQETYLLFDNEIDSARSRQMVATVVAHELAHQWFGNLVTCEWWDDLWLNEGVTSYLENLGIDSAEPTWGIREHFSVKRFRSVFGTDALVTSHPIRRPVSTPAEIGRMFDSITYSKGALITRMLMDILGEEVFIKGLRHYLYTHRMGNVVSDDLWIALTEADKGIGDNDVKKIMDPWTLQMGYPVVDLRRINANQVNVSQEHFLVDPEDEVDDKYGDQGYLWYIYLTYTQKTDVSFDIPHSIWIEKEPWALVDLPSTMKDDDWYLVNIKQYGFFRVNYDDENWARLTEQLLEDHTVFPIENRAQLINDAFSLAQVGRVGYPTALNLTLYLMNEMEYVPWEAFLWFLPYITDMFSRYSGYGHLERYMNQQVRTLYDSVGWDDNPETDPHLQQLNRINAIEMACQYNNQDCLDRALNLYHLLMENDANNIDNRQGINPITPNLRKTAYCYGIQEGGEEEWDFGWKKFKDVEEQTETLNWLNALSCSKRPWILSRFLSYSLNSTHLKKPDSFNVIQYVSLNPVGRAMAWDFFRNEFDNIREYFGDDSQFNNIITVVTANFNTEFELKELLAFGEDGKDLGSAKSKYEEAIEKTRKNIAWMEAHATTIAQWLEEAAPRIGE